MSRRKTDDQLKKQHQRLLKMATRAAIARDRFSDALEKAKDDEQNWAAMCEVTDTSPESDVGDWMC